MKTIPKTRGEIEIAVFDSAIYFHKELNLEGVKIGIGYKKMIGYKMGYMNQRKNHDDTVYYPIYLNKKSGFYQSVATMAHEMVHVKQFHTKDLNRNEKGVDLWKGKDLNWLPYSFRPWEIQAFRKELGLFNKYIVHKEYPKPGIMFNIDMRINSFHPYIFLLLIIGYSWAMELLVPRVIEYFGR